MTQPPAAPRILRPDAFAGWRKHQISWLTALGVAHAPAYPDELHSRFSAVEWRGERAQARVRVGVIRSRAEAADPKEVAAPDEGSAGQWTEMATVIESESTFAAWVASGHGRAAVWGGEGELSKLNLSGYPVAKSQFDLIQPDPDIAGKPVIKGLWRYLRPRLLRLDSPQGLAEAVACWYDAPLVCRYVARKLRAERRATLFG